LIENCDANTHETAKKQSISFTSIILNENHTATMGQRKSKPYTPASISDRLISTNPEFLRYRKKNAALIEALRKWANDEFQPDRYSNKKSDPEALKIEIEKKCRDKVEDEWVKFSAYPQKKESWYKSFTLYSMVDVAQDNLKLHQYLQDLNDPSAP
jgi:predicted transposase YbfD/YdcC